MSQEKIIAALTSKYMVIAGEFVTVEIVGGVVYVFCEELGTLRIFKEMIGKKNVNQGYSENIGSFFVSIE